MNDSSMPSEGLSSAFVPSSSAVPMEKRPLGTSGLSITPVGVGAFAIGGWMWGGQDDAQSEVAIRAALDTGVNWIDTAPIYGEGKASSVVGRVLKSIPPSRRPLVFTKFGHHVIEGRRVTDGSAAQVEKDCEEELTRLGVSCLDVFQLHWPAPQPMEETAEACARLLTAGKIRAVGVSNFNRTQLAAWKAAGGPLHSVQNSFSLVDTEPLVEVLPWCREQEVGFLAYSPLYRGLLSGTWTRDKTFPSGDHRGERDDFSGSKLAYRLKAVEKIRALCARNGRRVPQLAVGRLLATPGVSGVIVGARNAAQGAALGTLAVSLDAEEIAAIDSISFHP